MTIVVNMVRLLYADPIPKENLDVTMRTHLVACLAIFVILASPALAQTPATNEAPAPQTQQAPTATPAQQVPSQAAPTQPAPVEQAQPAAPSQPDNAEPEPGEAERSLALPHNLSPWGMFMGADIVVKAVMVGLAFASLVTWTVWLAKSLELLAASRRATAALRRILGAHTLSEATQAESKGNGATATMLRAADEEVRLSAAAVANGDGNGLKERVASHLSRIEAGAGRRMTRGTGLLATIGSTAPFVGLFGTVWGIMNSFIGISEAQTTNLAIVAPGIAEALLATAIGLVAAIPAVIIYNMFARAITGYRQLLGDTSAAIERLVSRDFDHRDVDLHRAAAE